MQTFLPYPNMRKSLLVLDYRRLGKQRVECKQILNALNGGKGWRNHPAVKMWRDHEEALKHYANLAIETWINRGYRNNMPLYEVGEIILPPWWGGKIHATHRANLLRKYPAYYQQFGWEEDPSMEYHWPV